MGIEQLADMVKLDKTKRETSDKYFFPDSDRRSGIELPTIGSPIIDENLYSNEGELYPDSARDFSDGPQWDENEAV